MPCWKRRALRSGGKTPRQRSGGCTRSGCSTTSARSTVRRLPPPTPRPGPSPPPPPPAARARLARAALPHLAAAWRDADGSFPVDARGLAAANVALEAQAEPEMLEAAGFVGAAWHQRVEGETGAALALVARVLDAFPS